MRLKNILLPSLLIIMLFLTNGCMSYLTYQNSLKQVALRKATLLGDTSAINAIKSGEVTRSGISVGVLEVLSERKVKQGFAAVGDVLLVVGGIRAAKEIDSGGDSGNNKANEANSADNANAGGDNFIVQGNNGDVIIEKNGGGSELGAGRTGDPIIVP